QIRRLRQRRVDRVVGRRAALAQDARAAAGVGETAASRLAELRLADIVGTRSEKEESARRGQLCGEPGELAVAAQRRGRIALRARQRRRIGDDYVKALSRSGKRRCLGKDIATAKIAALGDAIVARRRAGQLQRSRRAVDPEHRRRAALRRREGKTASV